MEYRSFGYEAIEPIVMACRATSMDLMVRVLKTGYSNPNAPVSNPLRSSAIRSSQNNTDPGQEVFVSDKPDSRTCFTGSHGSTGRGGAAHYSSYGSTPVARSEPSPVLEAVELNVNVDHPTGNRAAQIQQRMQFHCGFEAAKLGLGKHRQAKIDGRRIQSMGGLIQFYTELVVGLEAAGFANQLLSEVDLDAPLL